MSKTLGRFWVLERGSLEELRILLFQVFTGMCLVELLLVLLFSRNMPTLLMMAWCLVRTGGSGNLLDRASSVR